MTRVVAAVLLTLACVVAASGDALSVQEAPVQDVPELVRAKAMTRKARDRLKEIEASAPSSANASPEAQAVMAEKAEARSKLKTVKHTERIPAEQEAHDILHSVPAGQDMQSKVSKEVKQYTDKTPYHPTALQVNVLEHSGSEDPQMPNAEKEASIFGKELESVNDIKVKPNNDVEDTAQVPQSTVTTTAFMQSYDDTMREIKFKSLKQASDRRAVDRAIVLKAHAIAKEKKSVLEAEKSKEQYLAAKVEQARKTLQAAKASQDTGDLDPQTAGELVAEEEENYKKALKVLNQEKLRLHRVKIASQRHNSEKGTKAELEQRKQVDAEAQAQYNKKLAMDYVEEHNEREVKNRENKKLREAERSRKMKRKDELSSKTSAAKESQQKSLENRKKGIEQAQLMEDRQASECKVSAWSSYGPCSRPCGGGMRSSVRSIVKASVKGDNCPSLARGKPCNQHACPKHSAAGLALATCEPTISHCADFTTKVHVCESNKPKEGGKPTDTQMIVAKEFSTPDPQFEDDSTDPQPSFEDTVLGPHEVREIGEDWQSREEAAEIRSAVGRVNQNAKGARKLLAAFAQEDFCKHAASEKSRYCKMARACANAQGIPSGKDIGESNSQAGGKLTNQAKQADPQQDSDAEFDSTLDSLLRGIPH